MRTCRSPAPLICDDISRHHHVHEATLIQSDDVAGTDVLTIGKVTRCAHPQNFTGNIVVFVQDVFHMLPAPILADAGRGSILLLEPGMYDAGLVCQKSEQ